MQEHLKQRFFTPSLYDGVTITDEDMTVLLWNFSGQLVGYQVYSPLKPKKADVPRDAKYFTHSTAEMSAVWGLETLGWANFFFVTEGLFDAARLHSFGISAIAVFGNNPTKLTSWLRTLPYLTIAAVQGDAAGMKLATCADEAVFLPEGHDVGSLSNEMFVEVFQKYADRAKK